MSLYHFPAFLARMKYIYRWSLMRNTIKENISEHSIQVSIVAHLIANIRNEFYGGNLNTDRVAVVAMFHDVNETITGDLPTPIKYFNLDIKDAYKSIEKLANEKLISMLPENLKDTYRAILFCDDKEVVELVKAADKICAYIKCIEEEKAGNKEFLKAKASILKQIKEIKLPEVKYFMENFIPSFSLSLDEIDLKL